jgi:hypothetical protein
MPEFERLYVKIIGDSNLDRTVDKDNKTLNSFEKRLRDLVTEIRSAPIETVHEIEW